MGDGIGIKIKPENLKVEDYFEKSMENGTEINVY
jgi:hypothetical protein